MRLLTLFLLLGIQWWGVQATMAAEPVGRLFSTPEQRSQLDALRASKRNQPVVTETVVQPTVIKRKPIILPDAINVQGYVKRTDGKKGTVWVNGKAIQERSGNKDVQVGQLSKHGKRVPIRIPANGKHLSLKPGQVYDPQTNKVERSRSYRIRRNAGRIGYAK